MPKNQVMKKLNGKEMGILRMSYKNGYKYESLFH